ncbi:MAG: CDP-alcohol phosphatidyltransferase family protein [Treponema sp.]|nr:CDP-alcohol phosphatidyltransferase family protein [Treponema sp.]
MKLSNKFTTMRLAFAPVFFIIYNLPIWFSNFSCSPMLAKITACMMIPLLAFFELTDYFDGHYARKNNEVSDFGKIYDPFADVMLNLSIFLSATRSVSGKGFAPILLFALLFYREFGMTFLRMVALSKGTAIAARKGGKFKTVFYITTGFFMLLLESLLRFEFQIPSLEIFRLVAICLMGICVLLSYISFFDYIRTFASVFKGKKDE